MLRKTAVIWGVTGQDGSYLAELLLRKGYYVVGVARRTSLPNTSRLAGKVLRHKRFILEEGDITDAHSVREIHLRLFVDEVYNLAAQSHVRTSFEQPSYTWKVVAEGTLNLLAALRASPARLYQASSSEMFGGSFIERRGLKIQNEKTPFSPNSPYAVAKLAAHHMVRVYRESYRSFACSGILFNHESPRRGEAFVTRKISKYVAQLATGRTKSKLSLGNLDSYRDWGHAQDYVKAMWLMLQRDKPKDYVIATGKTHSVREFLATAWNAADLDPKTLKRKVRIDGALLRPSEVDYLCGDAGVARRELGWRPSYSFYELVREMVYSDIQEERDEVHV